MTTDPHSLPVLRVYIDETGDRGFSAGSSTIFGFIAVLVPDENDNDLREAIRGLRAAFGLKTGAVHWAEHLRARNHERRRHAAITLAAVPGVKVIYAAIDKLSVAVDSEFWNDRVLIYNFALRMLFERIALAARDWDANPRHTVVKIAHVRGLDHSKSLDYIRDVCAHEVTNVDVPWALVTANIQIDGQPNHDGLQAADLYGGMFNAAITHDRYGNCSPEYLLRCAHQIRRKTDGRVLGYGIKVLGNTAIVTGHDWWASLETADADVHRLHHGARGRCIRQAEGSGSPVQAVVPRDSVVKPTLTT